MLIGIAGFKGSGKSTATRALLGHFERSVEVRFADPLKEFVAELYGWEPKMLDDQKFKETPDRRYVMWSREQCRSFDDVVGRWHENVYGDIPLHEVLGLTWEEYKDWVETGEVHLTPRRAMQAVGEGLRQVCADTWMLVGMQAARSAILNGATHVVFSDVRHQNEVDAILAADGAVLRVSREGCGPGEHPSEKAHLLTGVKNVEQGSLETILQRLLAALGA